jgi:release factor glutamine methyltransferase
MKYITFLNKQSKRALEKGLEKEAIKLLMLELSGKSGAEFVSMLHDEIAEEQIEYLTKEIDKYIVEGIPVQHIIGHTYFYGYKMKVNKEVLIPRPETEELVGYVLSYYDEVFGGNKVDVVDVGTGSGAIAIALAKEEANMTVKATDISSSAVEVAKENASVNGASVEFMVGDMLEPLIERNMKFDILVSNPPYIPDDEYVEDIVKNNEPHVALFGGNDGMKFYDIILSNAHKVLKTPNILAFEHGYRSKEKMIELAKKYFPNSEVISIKDLSDKDRMTVVINK